MDVALRAGIKRLACNGLLPKYINSQSFNSVNHFFISIKPPNGTCNTLYGDEIATEIITEQRIQIFALYYEN